MILNRVKSKKSLPRYNTIELLIKLKTEHLEVLLKKTYNLNTKKTPKMK